MKVLGPDHTQERELKGAKGPRRESSRMGLPKHRPHDCTTAHDRTAFTIARRPTADCSRPFHRPTTARPHVVNDPIIANYPTTHSNDISRHGLTVITIIAFYKRRANENTLLSPREVFTLLFLFLS